MDVLIESEQAMEALGAQLAACCTAGIVIYLSGDLGTGKTTLVRGFIHALGFEGNVKSPTYTLVEHYEAGEHQAYHFDLYRLTDPAELEFMGMRDYFQPQHLCLVEWPERGGEWLPIPDIRVHIDYKGQGRQLRLSAETPRGRELLASVSPS